MNSIEFIQALGPDIMSMAQGLDFSSSIPNGRESIDLALSKTVLLGGKRLRPLLTFMVSRSLNLNLKDVEIYAKTIEKIHAASLAHDDVIDNATTRRGHDSINIVTTNKKAVLAGDYLLANVITELCAVGNLQIVSETAKVIKDLSEGEWVQLDLITTRNYSMPAILEIANLKTASVMKWCCVVPAIKANLPTEMIELWRKFGYHLGLAFQLIDDTLDFIDSSQTSHSIEKDQLLDLQNGIVNSVTYYWLRSDPKRYEGYLKGEDIASLWNQNSLNNSDENNEVNSRDIQKAMTNVKELAFDHIDECFNLLSKIKKSLQADLAYERMHTSFCENEESLASILNFLRYRNH